MPGGSSDPNDRGYEDIGRESKTACDWTSAWEAMTPVAQTHGTVAAEIKAFCESKHITLDSLAALGTRYAGHLAAPCLAYAGGNGNGKIVAIKYRPLHGTSHDSFAQKPSVWMLPIIIGERDSLQWLIVEGETDGARIHGLVGDRCAILVLPLGAHTFRDEWAKLIPRGATVGLCHDADRDGDKGAEVAAAIIGSTIRVRPPETGDWCDWTGDRDDFAKLATGASRSGAVKGKKLRVLDTHGMTTTEPAPIDWMVEGIFARGKLTMFGGREKQGKSLVQLAVSVQMASGGGEIAGIASKPGKVLLIDAENGEREIHRRLRSIGLDTEHAGNLIAVEARGVDLRGDLKHVEALLDEHRPDLLLLDSFRALWRGDERDEAAVASALDPLRAVIHDRDIAASITHHAQKGGDEYRGSTAIGAAMDWAVMLSREREDPLKAVRRKLSNPLARFAPERPARWLQVISQGDDGPISLHEAEPFIAPDRDTPRGEVKEALKDHLRGVSGVVSLRSVTRDTPYFALAGLARAVGRDPKDQTVRRALEELLKEGFVERGDDKRWRLAAEPAPPPEKMDLPPTDRERAEQMYDNDKNGAGR